MNEYVRVSPEHDEVRVDVGERVPDLVQRRRQPGLADDVGRAAGQLVAQEVAVASADVQIEPSGTCRPERRSRADRSRGVKIELFVRTRKGRFALDQPLQELRGARQGVFLADEDAVHIGQPALGFFSHGVQSLKSGPGRYRMCATTCRPPQRRVPCLQAHG